MPSFAPDTLIVIANNASEPATNWLPIAAAILAAISALIAAVYGPIMQQRVAHQTRVAESRRQWISTLREQVSFVLAGVGTLRDIHDRDPKDEESWHKAFNALSVHAVHVRLMLDPKKPKHIALSLAITAAVRAASARNPEYETFPTLMATAEAAATQLLDEAWERIKSED